MDSENLRKGLIKMQIFYYIYAYTYDGKTATISMEL